MAGTKSTNAEKQDLEWVIKSINHVKDILAEEITEKVNLFSSYEMRKYGIDSRMYKILKTNPKKLAVEQMVKIDSKLEGMRAEKQIDEIYA